ncbi:MAG: imidazole glycerol phosphate synthase subunit HisH [Gemmatimonadetes bacterium]|nr:imidazole glycerol phosphate synthase subunit HisH [Gemmatimonadota bacterium]
MKVALFDYGAGNLHSLGKALERGGAAVRVTADWDEALAADALVLPGVGAFSAAVEALPSDPSRVREALEAGLPCLGICLGMQLLFESSEEGEGTGIGILAGSVRRLRARVVPQMGWNDVETAADPLFAGEAESLVAYYANSYVCEPLDGTSVIGWSDYDGHRFAAAVRVGATWGVQFHPEKSSAAGLRLVANFLEAARSGRGATAR